MIWKYIQRVMRDRDEIADKIAVLRKQDKDLASLQKRALNEYKRLGGQWK